MNSLIKIIDAHGHLGGWRFFSIPHHDIDDLIICMDRTGVEKVCLSPFAGLNVDCRYSNDLIAQAIGKYEDRVLGYACVCPHKKHEIIPELERCFDKLHLNAIKLHPSESRYPADGTNYTPVYEFAQERKIAILNHSWGTPDHLRRLADKYPDVKFIQAHTAGGWDGLSQDGFIDAAREFGNVYMDTASSAIYRGTFEKLVDYLGEDKIVYGSDYTCMDMGYQMGRVIFSKIRPEAMEKILRNNFLSILKHL